MSAYAYIVVGSSSGDQYKRIVLERLEEGYEILTATATAKLVHYVMRKDK